MINCPLCNKLVSLRFPMHNCGQTLAADEYVNEELGVRLLWTPDHAWSSYTVDGGDMIERLAFNDVVEWVGKDKGFVAEDGE